MERTVAQKLDALIKLQTIDSELDEIKKIRGALPEEVGDLEDDLEGLKTRKAKQEAKIEELEAEINKRKSGIKESEALITKYKDQQNNVRNNREYDAITKELELQELEIQVHDKKIKEASNKIEQVKSEIETTTALIEDKEADLQEKKKELEALTSESEEDEKKLLKDREKAVKDIEDNLYRYYERLRKHLTNGLAVVTVKNGAAQGCNIVIPPQKIAEIRERKRLIIDEHSGRILAGVDDEPEFQSDTIKKPKRRTTKRKTKTTKKKS
ncbi:hypothetical protein OO013_15450 [Mangrovivirga sp. M17]|uniref:C4-type zinc ribbon domain-containing protein n=1 Tax=Mangrovivirga halotolerans TaxID=2993936 RepID=A0ABT3RV90_9BACT|nr:C4-type zinc ribbon domain-containing protein [Mangrovivirga halotolerans]MCX2745273.1 hypothetical protein [Mangrovivirga halotolerans]